MIERFSYDPFVLPYTIGLVFILTYLFIATSRVLAELPLADRTRLRKHILSKDIFKTFKDIFLDCFIHTKIWKRNRWLGYMHMSIALGWFMLIVIGHFEVQIFCPHRINLPYFPIFFRYFVMEANLTLKGSLFFFLMDLFLLMVLSGVGLAIYKRFRKQRFGMRRTTKLRLPDQIAMYSLWCIFPLRLMAESFTAGITKDGSFLTRGFGLIFENFVQNEAYIRPIWWGYSCALAMFFFTLPWSRYMHIVSEFLLIPMRNAGIRESRKNKGYARVELYSCSRCGICIDACQLSSVTNMQPKTTVYFLRELRDKDVEASKEIASYCMQCRRCVEACPVEIDSCELKLMQKQNAALFTENQFDYLDKQKPETRNRKPYISPVA